MQLFPSVIVRSNPIVKAARALSIHADKLDEIEEKQEVAVGESGSVGGRRPRWLFLFPIVSALRSLSIYRRPAVTVRPFPLPATYMAFISRDRSLASASCRVKRARRKCKILCCPRAEGGLEGCGRGREQWESFKCSR